MYCINFRLSPDAHEFTRLFDNTKVYSLLHSKKKGIENILYLSLYQYYNEIMGILLGNFKGTDRNKKTDFILSVICQDNDILLLTFPQGL